MVHLGCGGLIDLAVCAEDIEDPLLSGVPRDDTGFDGREVAHMEDVSGRGDEGGADKLRQGGRHRGVAHGKFLIVPVQDEPAGIVKGGKVILGKILHLDETACPSARSRSSAELEEPVDPAVRAHA